MKAFGYVRVSGRGQVDGDGPERQKEAIQKFCAAHGLGEVTSGGWYEEEAVSGTVEALSRPMFSSLLDDIGVYRMRFPGAPVCIVVERMDRIARDLIVSELLLKECAARHIPVYAADQGLVDQTCQDADPTRKLIRQIMGALAEWEKAVIVKKLRAARDRKREAIGRCEGVDPFGSRPDEGATLYLLRQYQLDGMSYGQIAIKANEQHRTTRAGKPWTKHSVYQVLNRR